MRHPHVHLESLHIVPLDGMWWVVDDFGYWDGPLDTPSEAEDLIQELREAFAPAKQD